MKKLIVSVCCAVFESLWRRLFGGWQVKPKFLNNRFVQHVINCLFLFGLFYFKFKNLISKQTYLILSCTFMTLAFQIEFWSRAHGAEFDEGRREQEDEETIKRYEKQWFNHYILTPLYNSMGWTKYKFTYDFFSMMFRYTYPCVYLYPFYGAQIFKIGLLVSPIYAFFWSFFEYENQRYVPTNLAEFAVGGIVGFLLCWFEPCGFFLEILNRI